MYINKALVYGNLTRDPELRSLPSGQPVTNFSLATNRVYKDRDGNRQESSEFHNIVVFGRQAENVSQYLKKGDTAYVEGRLQTRSWESDGQKRSRTEIVADRVQFGPKGGNGNGQGGGANNNSYSDNAPSGGNANAGQQQGGGEQLDTIEYPEEESNPEDIPF